MFVSKKFRPEQIREFFDDMTKDFRKMIDTSQDILKKRAKTKVRLAKPLLQHGESCIEDSDCGSKNCEKNICVEEKEKDKPSFVKRERRTKVEEPITGPVKRERRKTRKLMF